MSTVEKIDHLNKVRRNLHKKLKCLEKGLRIKDFTYKSYAEWKIDQKIKTIKTDFDNDDDITFISSSIKKIKGD